MLPDLDRLIRLQELETAVTTARQAIAAFPSQREALEKRLAEHTRRLEAADLRLTENQAARRVLEKDVAEVQARLSRSREHSMAVKTNKELWAIQAEMENANAEIRRLEDRILERMLEADDLADAVQTARQALEQEQAAILDEQSRLERERERFQARVERHAEDRAALVTGLAPHLLDTFETLIRGRRGTAVGAVRDGRCGACQVRLRPQLYNDIRANERLIQCESCQRILYYPRETEAEADTPAPPR